MTPIPAKLLLITDITEQIRYYLYLSVKLQRLTSPGKLLVLTPKFCGPVSPGSVVGYCCPLSSTIKLLVARTARHLETSDVCTSHIAKSGGGCDFFLQTCSDSLYWAAGGWFKFTRHAALVEAEFGSSPIAFLVIKPGRIIFILNVYILFVRFKGYIWL